MIVPIDSATPTGGVYLPWRLGNNLGWQMAIGYALVGTVIPAAAFAGGREKKAQ